MMQNSNKSVPVADGNTCCVAGPQETISTLTNMTIHSLYDIYRSLDAMRSAVLSNDFKVIELKEDIDQESLIIKANYTQALICGIQDTITNISNAIY